jgi:hypothetical protein
VRCDLFTLNTRVEFHAIVITMDKVGQKLVRNLKSRKYEVMDGVNNPDRVETLQIARFSPDSYSAIGDSNHNTADYAQDGNGGGKKPLRDPGNDIEMTAAVSGVVPDGTYILDLSFSSDSQRQITLV